MEEVHDDIGRAGSLDFLTTIQIRERTFNIDSAVGILSHGDCGWSGTARAGGDGERVERWDRIGDGSSCRIGISLRTDRDCDSNDQQTGDAEEKGKQVVLLIFVGFWHKASLVGRE